MTLVRGVAACVAAGAVFLLAPRLRKLVRKLVTKPKLTYFDLPGLGEPIRFTLAMCGVEFEDHRFSSRDEFMAMKPSLKFGQVPCLTVPGEAPELYQSASIMRFVARAYDTSGTLYPTSLADAALCDALLDQVKDLTQGWGVLKYRERFGFPVERCSDEIMASCKEYYLADTLPRHLGFFERALSASPTAWLCGGSSPTIADLMVACVIYNTFVKSGELKKVPPAIMAHIDAVYSLPAVAAFKASEVAE